MNCRLRAVAAGMVILAVVLLAGPRPARAEAPSAPAAPSGLAVPAGPATAPATGPLGGDGVPCFSGNGCNPLGGVAGGMADAVGRAVFDSLVAWVAEGAAAALTHVSGAMERNTTVDLGTSWFTAHLARMRDLAVAVLLPLMLVGIVGAVIHRDLGRLVRAAGVFAPVALIGGALVVQMTNIALQASDQMTRSVAGDMQGSTVNAVKGMAAVTRSLMTPVNINVGGLLAVVVLLLVIAGAFLIWIELLIRSAAIYVVVLFLPIALSGLVWPATARWTRKMIESLAALILSKFVIVAVISLAADMIAANGSDKLDSLMSGAALLLLAAFAPFALLRLIPIAEAGVIGHLEGMERRPIAAAVRATETAARLVMGAAGLLEGGDGGEVSGSGGGGGGGGGTRLPISKTPGGQVNEKPGEGPPAHPGQSTSGPTAAPAALSAGLRAESADDGG